MKWPLAFLGNRPQFAFILFFVLASRGWPAQTYNASGLVVKVERARNTVVVSCESIPGYMDAMVMPYPVRNVRDLDGLTPGAMIDFVLVVTSNSAYAEKIHVHGFQSLEQDPLTAQRLKLLNGILNSKASVKPLNVGEAVPDFALIDQNNQPVSFRQFSGKIVVMNFIYTRCALPNYCFRLSNNLGQLQKRFRARLGIDLILVTVTFDPVHDTPEALAHYSAIWKADPRTWHFLTGRPAEIERVCNLFGVDFFSEEGLFDHSLHTAIVGRDGRLISNLEGNIFSAKQLGDLIEGELGQ